jgi:hypothetical protein
MKSKLFAKTLLFVAVLSLCPLSSAMAQERAASAESPPLMDTALAAAAQQALSLCLVQNTSERDKQALVKWIFAVVSRHPDVRPMVNVSAKEDEVIGRAASAVLESLLADKCTSEVRKAVERSGTDAIKQSFEYLGKTAMESLLEHPDVNAAAADLGKYSDTARIERALGGK